MKLLQWQWSNYPNAHRDRYNLLLHLFTAPLFATGLVLLPIALFARSPLLVGAGFGLLVLVLLVQGRGHARELEAPARFRGPLDFVARLLAEQLITFPRFVFSGEFFRALRGDGREPREVRAR